MGKKVLAVLLMLLLLICGVGAARLKGEALLAPAASAREAMETAWRSDERDREAFCAEGDGDIITMQDNTLFIIRKKQLGIYHAANGGIHRYCTLDVGFWWTENREENVWVGCEKTPLELFVSGDRLAVLSAWVEYSEVWTEGERKFSDLSRTVLDIFDISNPANPVVVASYGQDGAACAGHVDSEGHLWLLSRRSVYESDFAFPAVHNSEHRIELEQEQVDVHPGGRAQMIVLGLYDLADGVRHDARALFGGGERAVLGTGGVYILGGDEAAAIRYAIGTERIEKPSAMRLNGAFLDAGLVDNTLYLATETEEHTQFSAYSADFTQLWEREMLPDAAAFGFGTDCFSLKGGDKLQVMNLSDRSLRAAELADGRTERLDAGHWLRLSYNADRSALDLALLRAGAKGTLKEAGGLLLGYDFRPALEEEHGLWLNGDLLALASETGCSLYRWDESGFVHSQTVFTADNSAHMRYFVVGDYLYIADTREVHALRLSDLAFVGEWFL